MFFSGIAASRYSGPMVSTNWRLAITLPEIDGERDCPRRPLAPGDYAFDVLGRNRVIFWMKPNNMASRRVAENAGMRIEKTTLSNHGRPAIVYSMRPADRAPA